MQAVRKRGLLTLAGLFHLIYTGVMSLSKVMTVFHAREMQDDTEGTGRNREEKKSNRIQQQKNYFP